MSNDLQAAARDFRRALQPLVDAVADPVAADAIREILRLPPGTAVGLPPQRLRNIDAFVAAADPGLDALALVVDDMIAIVGVFRDLVVAGNAAPAAVAEEMALGLVTMLTINAARRDALALYALLRFLAFVDQQLTTSYNDNLHTERLAHFFRDAVGYLRSAFALGTPAEAQATGDVLLLPLAAILMKLVPTADVLYGWDPAPGSPTPAADAINRRTLSVALTARTTTEDVGLLGTLLLGVIPVPQGEGGPGLFVSLGGSGTYEIPLGGGTWTLRVALTASEALSFLFADPTRVFGPVGGLLRVELRRTAPSAGTRHVVGDPGGTRFEYADVSGFLELGAVEGASGAESVFDAHVLLHDAAFVVKPDSRDGFLSRLFGGGDVRVGFEFGIGFASNRGVYLTGSTGLKVTLPLAASLGPLRISYVVLELKPSAQGASVDGLAFEASAGFSVNLGVATAVIDQLGVVAYVRSNGAGLEYKPPKGIGLAVRLGPISGGGYLFYDSVNGQYAGAVALTIGKVVIKGFALISTIEGPPRRDSVLAIVSAEWPGGWPIGTTGFTVNGLGVMLGVNRTVNTERLLSGVKDRLLDSVLFPRDPIADAPQIVSNLATLFPPLAGRYVFGASVKIQYGKPLTLATVNLGLALEIGEKGFDGPVRILVMGQLKLAAPKPEVPAVVINVDLVGVIDTGVPMVAFNASLSDSKVLNWALTGDAAFRWQGGNSPAFLLSFGGFHPRFTPPGSFPSLDRLAISLSNSAGAEVRCEAYLAVTSNTFQFGAKAGAVLRAGGFSVEGHLSFDALVTFDPFGFRVDIEAAIAVKRGSTTLLSAQVNVVLSGPRPFHLEGQVAFKILFVSFTVRFETSFGASGPPDPAVTASVQQAITAATADYRSWQAVLEPGLEGLVSLRALPPSTDIFVHPLADLVMSQQVAPLGVELARYGTARIDGPRRFRITSVRVNGTVRTDDQRRLVDGMFARGQFFDLTDQERLSAPSFERMQAGVQIDTGGVTHGAGTEANLVYETIVRDPENEMPRFVGVPYRIGAHVALALADGGAAGIAAVRNSGRSPFAVDGVPTVAVREPAYALADTRTLGSLASGEVGTYTALRQQLDLLLAADSGADVAVVGLHEVVSR